MRRWSGSMAAVTLSLSLVLLATSCGASNDGDDASSDAPTTSVPTSSTSTTTTTAPAPTAPPPAAERECGPLTADDVAVSAGVAVSEVRRIMESTGDPTCSFVAGQLTFTSWEGIPAALEQSVTTVPPPGIPGVAVSGGYRVDMERGGRYVGSVGLFPPGRAIEIRVRNDAGGSDTYPPADGPAQRERTEAATLAVAQRVAAGL